MRRIINSTYITIDGAVENPHHWPSSGDSQGKAQAIQTDLLEQCDVVLMGRRTYESFAAAWPNRSGDPYSDRINAMTKVVVSTTLSDPAWNNTTVIRDDVPAALARLKERPGGDIVQYGLGRLSYTMLEHGLLDELRLWLHPQILGREGPHTPHFPECPPAQFTLVDTTVLPNGVAILRYAVRASGRAP
ncbi:MAG TPA: dihydrofolate reductase family protein [Gemmatimonadaceae bacterium]|nr:dihydrofolate reductase family protein [Gemmatimonadaceae bacterium]